MPSHPRYKEFVFESVSFDDATGIAEFRYSFDRTIGFKEVVQFDPPQSPYCGEVLRKVLEYCHVVLGSSYYKLFPGAVMVVESFELTQQQAQFFTDLYRGGLSQFIYENDLKPEIIRPFVATIEAQSEVHAVGGEGIILQQSGGKDSLLAAKLLAHGNHAFDAWHMSSTGHHPAVIDQIGAEAMLDVRRTIDLEALRRGQAEGGLNGHVPFSAITAGLAMVSAVIHKRRYVVSAMESSSDEPNTYIGDFPVNHMYSKTFSFEQALQNYIKTSIATDLDYLSLIRPFTDLRVAELFAEHAWVDFGQQFASCNVGNYKQGEDDGSLTWCGNCSKCANSFLLFAAFIDHDKLTSIFSGKNLFENPDLRADFEALLGLGGVKPFECVGTVDELRAAYHLANQRDDRYCLKGLVVPEAREDFRALGEYQPVVEQFIADLL